MYGHLGGHFDNSIKAGESRKLLLHGFNSGRRIEYEKEVIINTILSPGNGSVRAKFKLSGGIEGYIKIYNNGNLIFTTPKRQGSSGSGVLFSEDVNVKFGDEIRFIMTYSSGGDMDDINLFYDIV